MFSNPFNWTSNRFVFVHPNRGREYVTWNVCQRERFAGHSHAVIIVVAALLALVLQNRNVHGDFYVRIIPAHPFDSGFKVGVPGHNHHRVGQPPNGIFQQIDRNVHVRLFFLWHLIFEAAHTVAGLAGDSALLIFAQDDFDLGQRAERLQVSFLAVTPGADVFQRIYQRREEFDADNFLVQSQRLKKRLSIQPFPRRMVLEYAKILVERIHVDGAALFGLRRRFGFRHRAVKRGQKSLK